METQKVDYSKYLDGFTSKEIEAVKSLISGEKAEKRIQRLQSSLYRLKPPTPKEFLDEWLGPGLNLYPHVIEMFTEMWDYGSHYHETVLYGATRCEAKGTKVLMYDLSIKNIEDIKIGDLLMGDDSKPRTVLEVVSGVDDMYRVDQTNGDPYTVNSIHKLVTMDRKNNEKIEETEIVDFLKLSKDRRRYKRGFKAVLDFPEQEVPISPWFLGIWLADGLARKPSITTMDKEVVSYLYTFAENLGLHIRVEEINGRSNKAKTYHIEGVKNGFPLTVNPLKNKMRELDLIQNKHIPVIYLKNSKKVRMELLSGILDGDGYYDGSGNYEIVQKNEVLSNNIVFLARSLGFKVTINKCIKGIKSTGFTGEYYRIFIRGDLESIPFKVERRRVHRNRKKVKNCLVSSLKVTPLGKGEYFGFRCDGNHRYLHPDLTVMRQTGKSVLARLSVVYCIVWLWCLKDPHKYYNLSKMSSLAIFVMCFAKKKSMALLLKPIENILKASPKFHQVIFADHVDKTQNKIGTEQIVWCTASKIGEFMFSNDIHLCLGSNPMDIIGADIVMAVISEINFFREVAGISEEDVWKVYTLTKDRIEGTIARRYGSMLVLDSSANNRDSMIEDYCLNKASKNPKVYFRQFTRWEAVPDRFPTWQRSGETFKVFKGNQSRPPAIVDKEFKAFPNDERFMINVPVDARDTFEKSIYDALRNIAGVPTGSENLFFPNMSSVELLFDDNLDNITRPIEASISEPAPDLIMNQVREVFMVQNITGKWELKRAKAAPRWVRIDLSEVSDRTGVAMCHPEITNSGAVYSVFDFAFDVAPGKDGINFDAVLEFIRGLYKKYHVNIAGVSTDRWQSSFIAQSVKKDKKNYRCISVDESKTPYMVFKSKVLNGSAKVGYYLNIYNNLKSLVELKTKIDHIRTRRDSEDNKRVGLEAKDICVSGDTKIALLDGTSPKIKDLVNKEVYIYSCTSEGRIQVGKARNIRKTGFRKDILRIWFDNNKYLDCTSDHKILMRDGTYKEAKDICINDSIMPLYRFYRKRNSKNGLNGYEQILHNDTKRLQYTHYMVGYDYLGFKKEEGIKKVIHHKDFNKRNNNPDNFDFMLWEFHRDLHNKVGKTNISKLWKDPEFRERHRKRVIKTGKKTGKINITKYNKSKERVEKLKRNGLFSRNGRKVFNTIWNDPEKRIKMIEKRTGDNNYLSRRDITWDRILRKVKETNSMESLCNILNCSEKPIRRRIREQGMSYTEFSKQYFRQVKHVTIEDIKKSFLKEKTMIGICRKLNICIRTFYNILIRNGYHPTSWVQFINNHKVVKIEEIKGTEVYDMTVDKYNNFAIDSGIFIHNCDSMSGASYHMFSEVGKYSIRYNYDDINQTLETLKKYKKTDKISNVDKANLYQNLVKNIMNKDVKVTKNIL